MQIALLCFVQHAYRFDGGVEKITYLMKSVWQRMWPFGKLKLPKCVFSQKEVGSLDMINYLLISIVGSFMFASCSHNIKCGWITCPKTVSVLSSK